MNNHKGSLLIELIFLLAIIGVILNITVLNTDIIYKIKLNKESMEFKRDIEKIRLDALKKSRRTSVVLDIKENSYKLKVKNDIVKSVYPETFKIEFTQGLFEFARTGAPSSAGTITLKHKYGEWDITISPATGKIRLKK